MFIKVAFTWLTTVFKIIFPVFPTDLKAMCGGRPAANRGGGNNNNSFVNNTLNFIVLIFTLQIFSTKYYTIVVYTFLFCQST